METPESVAASGDRFVETPCFHDVVPDKRSADPGTHSPREWLWRDALNPKSSNPKSSNPKSSNSKSSNSKSSPNYSLGLWVPAPVRNCALGRDDTEDVARGSRYTGTTACCHGASGLECDGNGGGGLSGDGG
jgi:hypothetical protein